jgi:hypothetical protein
MKKVRVVIILTADAENVPNLHCAVNASIDISRGYGVTVDLIAEKDY